MKQRCLRPALGAVALTLGLALGALARADTVTYPPSPLITINHIANSLGTAVNAATTKSNSLTGNTVTLAGGTVTGLTVGAVNAEDADSLDGNSVTVTGGTATGVVYGGLGFFANGTPVTNNSVTISAGQLSGNDWFYAGISGGSLNMAGARGATATDNKVDISAAAEVSGGWVVGGMGGRSATGNTVSIGDSAAITGTGIAGGFTIDNSASAAATGNTVNITGGTVSGSIIGGMVFAGCIAANTYESSNNTVTISGTPDLSGAFLQGGLVRLVNLGGPGPGVCPTPPHQETMGNTLNLQSAGLTVASVSGFQNLDFKLPATLAAGSAVLTVTTGSSNIGEDAVIHVSADPGLTLNAGDQFTLIDASGATLLGTVAAASKSGTLNGHPYTLVIEEDPATAYPVRLVLKIGGLVPTGTGMTATAVPATGNTALAALALMLAALAALALRRRPL